MGEWLIETPYRMMRAESMHQRMGWCFENLDPSMRSWSFAVADSRNMPYGWVRVSWRFATREALAWFDMVWEAEERGSPLER